MKTVGEEIKKNVSEYQKLYRKLLKDPKFKDQAVNLARHDLIIHKWIAEGSLRDFDAWLEKQGVHV